MICGLGKPSCLDLRLATELHGLFIYLGSSYLEDFVHRASLHILTLHWEFSD
jgi:hypothetical protein